MKVVPIFVNPHILICIKTFKEEKKMYDDQPPYGDRQFLGGLFPGGGNQFPGQMPPSGNQTSSPPNAPPPSFTPVEQQIQPFAVDPGAIRGCLYRFTYVWLNRDQFWYFPTFVGRNSVAGFRWRRNRWVYFGIDLNRIQSFQC